MECKKCGNMEIKEFDYGTTGVGMGDKQEIYIVCLCCDNRVYNPSKEMIKELMDGGDYRK